MVTALPAALWVDGGRCADAGCLKSFIPEEHFSRLLAARSCQRSPRKMHRTVQDQKSMAGKRHCPTAKAGERQKQAHAVILPYPWQQDSDHHVILGDSLLLLIVKVFHPSA
eukprot:Tamp_16269.p1 GENE.Tamp_16269~~Tamp_16269.p1  ORF type:complete len:111 (+),score=7.45 Tamp_16269:576-908(+)